MILHKCYVQNFGTLSDYSYEFNSGLNTIIADNGTGKSTLAVFIKSMFYGLDPNSKHSLDENERKKYKPWSCNRFGGYIDFSVGNKSYHLVRFFENKEETFELFDLNTNKVSKDYTKDIGFELFKVDADGFERSTYLPQKLLKKESNTTILAKLTNLTFDTNDLSNYDTASESLQQCRRSYQATSGGSILDSEARLRKLNEDIEKSEQAISAIKNNELLIEGFQARIDDASKKLNSVQKEKSEVLSKQAQIEINEHYNTLKQEVDTCQDKINELNEFFTYGEVDEQTVKEMNRLNLQVNADSKTDFVNDEKVTSKKATLDKFFECGVPEKQKVDSMKELLNIKSSESNNIGKTEKIALILSIIFAATGLIYLAFSTVTSIIFFVLMVLSLLGYIYFHFNAILKGDKQIGISKESKKQVELFLDSYFDKYESYESAFNELNNNIVEYNTLNEIFNSLNRKSKEEELENNKNKIEKFLSSYFENVQSYDERLMEIEQKRNSLISYKKLLIEKRIKLKDFENKKKVTTVNIENARSLSEISLEEDALNTELKQLNSEKVSIITSNKRLAISADVLSDLEEQKENEQIKLEELKANHEALKDTVKYLKQAKDNLNAMYGKDIEERFKHYLSKIIDTDLKVPHFDSDLDITFEKMGERKEIDYFSAGYKDIIDVCARLALVDCLFKDEKPFVIFDDPFVNLDDEKLEKAKELLKQISTEMQVIYLVCHSSRG